MGFRAPRPGRGQRQRLTRKVSDRVEPLVSNRDPSGLARTAGRATLWACVGLLLARGVGDVLTDPQPAAPAPTVRQSAATSFPDDEALAFATGFARTYLTSDADRETRLASYFATSLSDQAAPQASPRSPGAAVAEAMVARTVPLGDSRALITVATFMRGGATRYLTVPVARDDDGRLAVYDLPSFSASPVTGASVEAPAATPLSGDDGDAVSDLTRRFLRAYLTGEDEHALAYLLAPDVHVAPLGAGLTVEAIETIARLGGSPARGMQLAATVRVRDDASGTTYRQRYRVAVERRDRWYVTGVAGGPRA